MNKLETSPEFEAFDFFHYNFGIDHEKFENHWKKISRLPQYKCLLDIREEYRRVIILSFSNQDFIDKLVNTLVDYFTPRSEMALFWGRNDKSSKLYKYFEDDFIFFCINKAVNDFSTLKNITLPEKEALFSEFGKNTKEVLSLVFKFFLASEPFIIDIYVDAVAYVRRERRIKALKMGFGYNDKERAYDVEEAKMRLLRLIEVRIQTYRFYLANKLSVKFIELDSDPFSETLECSLLDFFNNYRNVNSTRLHKCRDYPHLSRFMLNYITDLTKLKLVNRGVNPQAAAIAACLYVGDLEKKHNTKFCLSRTCANSITPEFSCNCHNMNPFRYLNESEPEPRFKL
jgi:hypothetical protein